MYSREKALSILKFISSNQENTTEIPDNSIQHLSRHGYQFDEKIMRAFIDREINILNSEFEKVKLYIKPFIQAAKVLDNYNSKVAPIVHSTKWLLLHNQSYLFIEECKKVSSVIDMINLYFSNQENNVHTEDYILNKNKISFYLNVFEKLKSFVDKETILSIAQGKKLMQPYIDREEWLALIELDGS